eukprot:evm.model.NODE_2219_length_28325_cov_37.384148.8
MASAAPTIKVVVTGGGGFLGRYLCQTLLRRKRLNGRALESIAILDDILGDTHVPCDTKVQVFPNGPTNGASSNIRLESYRGDITDRKLVQEVLSPRPGSGGVVVFHLASIMSGQGETQFDKCLSVNLGTSASIHFLGHGVVMAFFILAVMGLSRTHLLFFPPSLPPPFLSAYSTLDGTRNLLEEARALHAQGYAGGEPVRFIFPSSIAAFGPATEVSDETKRAPQSTYGTTKVMAELLINDFTRKGWIDGRTGRLPTVIVRPGNVNGAATGCFSAVVREVLMGHDYVIPIDPRQSHPVISARRTVKGLLALAEVESEKLGFDRSVNLPALQTTMDELLFHTRQIAQGRGIPIGEVGVNVDPWVSGIVGGMPQIMHSPRANALGLPRDGSVEAVIEEYVDEFLDDEMKDDYPLFSM